MRRFTALLLSLCLAFSLLTFSGCGEPDADEILITVTFTDPDASGDASGDAVTEVLTVSYGVGNFYAKYMQTYYGYMYYYIYGDDFWNYSTDASSDATLATDMVAEFMESLSQMTILKYHASEYGVELSEEDYEAIAEAAAEFIEDNAGEAIRSYGVDEQSIYDYLELYTISLWVQEAIFAECDVEIDEEDALCRTFSYVSIATEDDESGDASGDSTESGDSAESGDSTESGDASGDAELTPEELVEACRLQGFDAAMEENGYTVYEHTYVSGDEDDSLGLDVINAADELIENEISDPIVTEDYTYIIRLDEDYDEEATLEKIEELEEEAQEEYYDSVYTVWLEYCEVEVDEDLMYKISFDQLYTYSVTTDGDDDDEDDEDSSGDASGDGDDSSGDADEDDS